jgi:hypothetical protein
MIAIIGYGNPGPSQAINYAAPPIMRSNVCEAGFEPAFSRRSGQVIRSTPVHAAGDLHSSDIA